MKKIIGVLVLLVNQLNGQAVFCSPGAEWNYLFDVYYGNSIVRSDNETIAYTHDSIIGTDTCKVLKHTKYFEGFNPDTLTKLTLIKQNGNIVYYRNYVTQNTWQILYNFGATVGQSWTTFFVNPSSIVVTNTVIVDAVSTVNYNGYLLKQLTVHLKTNSLPYKWKITERFGTEYYLFYNEIRLSSNWKDQFNSFLCYKDNQFGTKQFTTYPCKHSNPVGIKNLASDNIGFELFPNPNTGIIQIDFKSEGGNYDIHFINSLGTVLLKKQTSFTDLKTELDVSAFESGIYFVMIFDKQKLIANRKVIKE